MDEVIRVEGLTKQFGPLAVLRGIDCSIKASEVVCVIGPSGSGKSTFLRCLNGLEDASGGRVLVRGVSVHDAKTDVDALRSEIGMVFQRFNLFPHKTVLENITLAPTHVRGLSSAQARSRAHELLLKVGLLDKLDAYPNQLSGGQQQRVAIARALVTDPALIVADEPTGDLDRNTGEEVLSLLDQLVHELGKTIVMVTHDPKAAAHARRMVHLEKGVLVDDAATA